MTKFGYQISNDYKNFTLVVVVFWIECILSLAFPGRSSWRSAPSIQLTVLVDVYLLMLKVEKTQRLEVLCWHLEEAKKRKVRFQLFFGKWKLANKWFIICHCVIVLSQLFCKLKPLKLWKKYMYVKLTINKFYVKSRTSFVVLLSSLFATNCLVSRTDLCLTHVHNFKKCDSQ